MKSCVHFLLSTLSENFTFANMSVLCLQNPYFFRNIHLTHELIQNRPKIITTKYLSMALVLNNKTGQKRAVNIINKYLTIS